MADWYDTLPTVDLAPGYKHEVFIKGKTLLVCNVADNFYAIENICTHDGGTLSDGWIEKDEIICPRHGARFCITNGDVTAPPAYEPIMTFPTRVTNGMIQVLVE